MRDFRTGLSIPAAPRTRAEAMDLMRKGWWLALMARPGEIHSYNRMRADGTLEFRLAGSAYWYEGKERDFDEASVRHGCYQASAPKTAENGGPK